MDNVDIAQRQQEIMLAQQLAVVQTQAPCIANNQNSDGDYECIDCGELVEPQRIKLGLTLRCFDCQQSYEIKQRK